MSLRGDERGGPRFTIIFATTTFHALGGGAVRVGGRQVYYLFPRSCSIRCFQAGP